MKMNHMVPQGDNQDFGLWSTCRVIDPMGALWHHQILAWVIIKVPRYMKGKTVTGTILMSTLQTFEDTPVAVINVRNKKHAQCNLFYTFIYHDLFSKHSYIWDLFAFYINLMTYMSL